MAQTHRQRGPVYVNPPHRSATNKEALKEALIEAVHVRHGKVTAKLMIDMARRPSSPYHQLYEWNDSIAGEKFREEQARQMIIASKFILQLNAPRKSPPLVSAGIPVRKLLPTLDPGNYDGRVVVLSDRAMRRNRIKIKLEQLRAWCREVSDIEELATLKRVIERNLP